MLLQRVLPNAGVISDVMTIKQFFEYVLAAALASTSRDESLIKAAVHVDVACMMRQQIQITHGVVRSKSKFDEAQHMRLDGKGSCEGRDFCGSNARSATHLSNYSFSWDWDHLSTALALASGLSFSWYYMSHG